MVLERGCRSINCFAWSRRGERSRCPLRTAGCLVPELNTPPGRGRVRCHPKILPIFTSSTPWYETQPPPESGHPSLHPDPSTRPSPPRPDARSSRTLSSARPTACSRTQTTLLSSSGTHRPHAQFVSTPHSDPVARCGVELVYSKREWRGGRA